jgi:hypothetical protein
MCLLSSSQVQFSDDANGPDEFIGQDDHFQRSEGAENSINFGQPGDMDWVDGKRYGGFDVLARFFVDAGLSSNSSLSK